MSDFLRFIAGFSAAIYFFSASAFAQNGDWRVVEMTGAVRLANPAAAAAGYSACRSKPV